VYNKRIMYDDRRDQARGQNRVRGRFAKKSDLADADNKKRSRPLQLPGSDSEGPFLLGPMPPRRFVWGSGPMLVIHLLAGD
jgi:hypothetical protein